MTILIIGRAPGRQQFIGPFNTVRKAKEWAYEVCPDEYWIVRRLRLHYSERRELQDILMTV